MPSTILNTMQLAGITPERLVIVNGYQDVVASSVERTYARKALITSDVGGLYDTAQIQHLVLDGLTSENSDAGTLLWSIEAAEDTVVFSLFKDMYTLVATGVSAENPVFPLTLELAEVEDSGLTGTVILFSGEPAEVSPAQRAHLPLPRPDHGPIVYGDDHGPDGMPQIQRIILEGVTGDNSDAGNLYWSIGGADNTTEFALYSGETCVASGISAENASLPMEIQIVEADASGISGSVILNTNAGTDTLEHQWISVPAPVTAWVTGDEEQNNIGSICLHGATVQNTEEGILEWTYGYQDDALWFVLLSSRGPVAAGSVEGTPYFPCEIDLRTKNHSGIFGTATLLGDMDLSEGYTEEAGHLIIRAPYGIRVDGDVLVSQDHGVRGGAVIAGAVSASDMTAGGLIVENLSGDHLHFLAVDSDGKLTTAVPMANHIYAQYSSPLLDLEYALGEPVSFFTESEWFDLGSRTIPESWWTNGKRLSIKSCFAWSKPAFSTLVLKAFLAGNSSSITLLEEDIHSESAGVDEGMVTLEIELMVAKTDDEEETLELRGHCLLNNMLYPLVLTGHIPEAYTFDITVVMDEVDAYSHVVPLSTTIMAYEPPLIEGLFDSTPHGA